MIIRQNGQSQLFIRQPDHAVLAEDIMRAWRADAFPKHPRRDAILFAVREHDNGWIEEDASTLTDDRGNPLDFVAAPISVKHRLWPRAVRRLERDHPYEAALIAQHALTVNAVHRTNEAWRPFFDTMEQLRGRVLRGPADSDFERSYRFVRIGDLLSLMFCNGWEEPHALPDGRRAVLTDTTLEVSPDPFDGAHVPLRVVARRLPSRTYGGTEELRVSLAGARVEAIEGIACGA